MTEPTPLPSDQFVQSLARGLAVITAFDAEHPTMTLSEVAARTDLNRAAARRFLHTLLELGFVRTDGRQFSLTPQVLRLGTAYLSGLGLPEIAEPHLIQLSADLGESCSLAVLDGADIVYVARVAVRRIMTVDIRVGTRFPAFATSMGRVWLAAMNPTELDTFFATNTFTPSTPVSIHEEAELRQAIDQVRLQGFALVDQELEPGLRSIAVPVRYPDGKLAGAINISSSVSRDPHVDLRNVPLTALRRTAERIAADLGLTQLTG